MFSHVGVALANWQWRKRKCIDLVGITSREEGTPLIKKIIHETFVDSGSTTNYEWKKTNDELESGSCTHKEEKRKEKKRLVAVVNVNSERERERAHQRQ